MELGVRRLITKLNSNRIEPFSMENLVVVGASTWGHPQPEVILPSLIPLVFERFLPISTLWLSPNSPHPMYVITTTVVLAVLSVVVLKVIERLEASSQNAG